MKRKDFLFIMVSGFILIIIWIGFNIYHNAKTSTIIEATGIQIAPIPKSFDTNTIDALKAREKITPIFDLQTTKIPVATISADTKTSSESAKENQATPSGIQQQ